jgi:tetratricopeptide (TPR) repeat protein
MFVDAGEKPWTEIRSEHFRLLTNGNVSEARHIIHEFEEMRFVFATGFPGYCLEGGAPLLVFAVRDEASAKSLAPVMWKQKGAKPAGFFASGWERKYALIRMDIWKEGADEIVYHEYTHSILHLNVHWLPTWLDEGIANFYGHTRFTKDKILVGIPPEEYLRTLERPLIPVETLISVDPSSPYYHDEDKVYEFYAESWALVHFMTFGPGMDAGARLKNFFSLLQEGTEQKKAFQQVFGDFKQVDAALQIYISRFAFHAGVIPTPAQVDENSFAVRALSVAESEAEVANFHAYTGDRVAARALAEQAIKDDPNLGLAHEVLGFMDFNEGKDNEALDQFKKACGADHKLWLSLFAEIMMSPIATSSSDDDENAFHDALIQVLKINPDFAPAFVQLAKLALRRGNPTNALSVSRKAEQLEPMRAGYHILSGQILLLLGRYKEAADFAKFVADRWYGADHDEAVELWNRVPPDQRPAYTLAETSPKDTKSLVGIVRSVQCGNEESEYTLALDHDGTSLNFHHKGGFAAGFSDTLWYGEDHFNLCHHLEGLRAIVSYRGPAEGTYAGDIAEVEIRDDPPVQIPVQKSTIKTDVPSHRPSAK